MTDLKQYLKENPQVLDDMMVTVPGYGRLKYKQVVQKVKELADSISDMAKHNEFEKMFFVLEKNKNLQIFLDTLVKVNKQVQ